MDPDGILKAWITKVLTKSARSTAIAIASIYSLTTDLLFFMLLNIPSLYLAKISLVYKKIYIFYLQTLIGELLEEAVNFIADNKEL
jgi:hypothetical protein